MEKLATAWANCAVLVISAALSAYYYVQSAGPAALEARICPRAYRLCSRFRTAVAELRTLATMDYVICSSVPLPLPALYSLVRIPIFTGICVPENGIL